MPSNIRYVSPPVELLGPKTPQFQTRIQDPQVSNQNDASDQGSLALLP